MSSLVIYFSRSGENYFGGELKDIEKGNTEKLSNVDAFTFEPHISLPGSRYGFKRENIYGFDHGVLIEL